MGGVVAQEPAPTLKTPTSPRSAPDAGGFIRRCLLLEPIASTGLTENIVREAVKKDYFPRQFTMIPRDLEKVKAGDRELAWHGVDSTEYNVDLFHFARALGKPTPDVLFWVVTIVHAPEEMRGVRLAIGSNVASVWWVNGQAAVGIYGGRQTGIDDGVSKRLTLKKGANVVRAAITNGGGATEFCPLPMQTTNR